MRSKEVKLESNDSLNRPSWTQKDLRAFRHKHAKGRVNRDFYVKTKGMIR